MILLRGFIAPLLLVTGLRHVTTTWRKSWPLYLFQGSNMTCDTCIKVKCDQHTKRPCISLAINTMDLIVKTITTTAVVLLCPPPWGVDILFLLFPPSDVRCLLSDVRCPLSDVRCPLSGVRRPMSGITHGFRSFKGKVLELLSPNLVCRLIGSVACLGLLLAVVPLLLTE